MNFHNRLSLLLLSTVGYVVYGFSIHRLKIEPIHQLRIRTLQTLNVVCRVIENGRRGIGIRTAIPILFTIPLEISKARRRPPEIRNAFKTFDSVSWLTAPRGLSHHPAKRRTGRLRLDYASSPDRRHRSMPERGPVRSADTAS